MKFFIAIFLGTTLTLSAQKVSLIKHLDKSTISDKLLTMSLRKIIDTSHVMGLSVVIINDNKIVYRKAFGYSNKENRSSLGIATKMYAASFTKPVSSYLFLKLVEKGIFNLDSPLVKYLKRPIGTYEKWKTLANEKLFNKITARMILSHSSGLPILRYLYGDSLRLIADPGVKFYYSNEGMNLLGFIIEEYTNNKLENIAEELIFIPFGMNNSSMIWKTGFDSDYALGYDIYGQVIGMSKRPVAKAAGSMTTTALNYAQFILAIMEKNGINKKLLNEMLSPQIKIVSKRGFGPERDSLTRKFDKISLSWGLGVGIFKSFYGRAFFHAGHDDGWQNYFVAYPDKKTAVILMSNSSNFEHVANKILSLCIGDTDSPLEWLGYYDNAN